MAARAFADPEAKRSFGTVAQFFDNQAGRASAVHKDGHLWPLDDHTDVKPFIAVGLWNQGLFVFVRGLGPKRLPGPLWVGGVLHSVAVPRRGGPRDGEWPEG